MKRISYKSILLILCLSMFSSTLSLSFVRAVVPPGDSCYLTETIVVFDEEPCNWGDVPGHAIKDIIIKYPVKSVYMKMWGYLSSSDQYMRAIDWRLDGRGENIDVRRIEKFQVRGYGVIHVGEYKTFPADPDYYDMSNCKFAKAHPDTGSQWLNFIPQDPSQTSGYFSPGIHTINTYITTPTTDSWISITLEITYKFIVATVDFDPDTLNPKSQGKWVTVYIEFPEADCDVGVSDIDVGTVQLNGLIQSEQKPTEIGDHDGDGNPDLMVKFDRAAVKAILEPGEKVIITISGELPNDIVFEGEDEIRVLDFG